MLIFEVPFGVVFAPIDPYDLQGPGPLGPGIAFPPETRKGEIPKNRFICFVFLLWAPFGVVFAPIDPNYFQGPGPLDPEYKPYHLKRGRAMD